MPFLFLFIWETESGTSCLICRVLGNETVFLACSASATYWASGDVQGKRKSPYSSSRHLVA